MWTFNLSFPNFELQDFVLIYAKTSVFLIKWPSKK